jgi:hypothetical protein
MGLAYGLVQTEWSQIARSSLTVVSGVILVVFIGYLSAELLGIKVTGSEMINRAFPTLLDLGVAMAAGAAGAFSYSRESIRNSVAGVAIAVALVPPLAVVGIGLALGRSAAADVGLSFSQTGLYDGGIDMAVGAFVLFLTNLAAILVVAGIVMVVQGRPMASARCTMSFAFPARRRRWRRSSHLIQPCGYRAHPGAWVAEMNRCFVSVIPTSRAFVQFFCLSPICPMCRKSSSPFSSEDIGL